jgi:hypothetical protein
VRVSGLLVAATAELRPARAARRKVVVIIGRAVEDSSGDMKCKDRKAAEQPTHGSR